ncbi:MAG: type II toxin-antitoxin system RelE/ParE family toxin [Fibrobacter sp.]|nr:type II toxin-antitoxin system RelE/ParE family toxin [Fibrobacter sp.]
MPGKIYTVEWSESAANDLRSIVLHIAVDSLKNAKESLAKIKTECLVLERFPELGKVPVELDRLQIGEYRELVVSPWRIFYRKEDDRVVVLAVVDSRRDLEDAIWKRMMFPVM